MSHDNAERDSQDNERQDDLLPAVPNNSGDILALGNSQQLDLSNLSEVDRNEITKAYASGKIELAKKAAELGIENQVMNQRLDDISHQVGKASEAGAHATISGAYNDELGRTEVMMGNTDTAAQGKLSRSQKGEQDKTIIYVVIAAIVLIIVAALIMGGK